MDEQIQRLELQILNRPQQTELELTALLTQARQQADIQAEAHALCLMAEGAFFQGNYPAALEWAGHGQALAQQHRLTALEARNHNALSMACWRLGRLPEALDHVRASLALAGDDALARSRALSSAAAIYIELGDHERALENFGQAAELARHSEQPEQAATPMTGTVRAMLHMGRMEALELVPEVRALAEQHGMLWLLCVLSYLEASLLHRLGRPEEGRACAEAGLAQAQQTGNAEAQGFLHQILAELYLASGALEWASAQLEQGGQIARQLNHLQLHCGLESSRAKLHQLNGDHAAALGALHRHIELSQQLHARSHQLHSRTVSQQIEVELLQRAAQHGQCSSELLQANRELQTLQERLSYQASHDSLTGLLNRSAFWTRTQERLRQRLRAACSGVIMAHISHLRSINGARGHAAGDILLQEIAQRFRAELRPGDLVGRLSGDEFMIYLDNLSCPEQLEQEAQRLLRSLVEPLVSGHLVIRPAISLGCAVAPPDGHDLGHLHQCADLALQQAKQQGNNGWVRFQPETGAAELRRQQLREDLRHALERGECELHYQPQFSLPERRLVGVEALLRWRHPQLGTISPAEFIPLAEEGPLILELGAWALREACCQAQTWNFGERKLLMSVNVSVRQFERPDFVPQVEAALAACGLPGGCLILELTETLLHQEAQVGAQTFNELHRLGVHIAIDDFGTGYSNIQLLRHLPFRQLKIDRSFVQDLADGAAGLASAQHFMKVMLNLAHGLGINVVAEGVETQAQFDLLTQLGCDKAQGFLLSPPLPAGELASTFL
ncbi:diguanylate cyclase/phosphodiesterase (plasmid) [Deinococcus proteolyticus MRP]|uniref:Diguanylate cyclase/phosphodiesterase n=1 Tax=Deinococcus proteolyticus (strain ATCC 35074 / DSM 20540 / JCM 6276 / NBRC 101906 / NCIMB 13154 / VKM Ac-1939 / CCM 2703 / MRP) TaxID=693977 RepID=F0RQV6_DEIPM|nr:EAL domain-containing protein [Deinococcus proteolyticus]ADY27665.1 diguanylate cyclase/phosphodiesterase [Deinococcus proteolyticus MRP]